MEAEIKKHRCPGCKAKGDPDPFIICYTRGTDPTHLEGSLPVKQAEQGPVCFCPQCKRKILMDTGVAGIWVPTAVLN